MIPVDGVVLAGGRSSRMGQPKPLLVNKDGVTLEQRAQQVLQTVCLGRIWISRPYGSDPVAADHLVDATPNCGPLAGIYAALTHSTRDLVAVLAVDLPEVTAALFEELYRVWHTFPETDVVYARSSTDGDPQPLAALWHRRTLPVIRAALDGGTRRVLTVVHSLTARALIVNPGILVNINSPRDWTNWLGDATP